MDEDNRGLDCQTELLGEISPSIFAGEIFVESNYDQYFDLIQAAFPFVGLKIAWSRVPGSIEVEIEPDWNAASLETLFAMFVERAAIEPEDPVVAIGDSAMNYALLMKAAVLGRHIKTIVDMPHQTYIIPPDVSWCACYNMEGYMSFGFRPGQEYVSTLRMSGLSVGALPRAQWQLRGAHDGLAGYLGTQPEDFSQLDVERTDAYFIGMANCEN